MTDHASAPVLPPSITLIYGPTASGKSALALAIAERTGAMIVNADALQVYRDWRVLSARPSPEEEAQAEHRLYGHVDAADPGYSVGRWLREVSDILDETDRGRARPLIVIGGTGLYFTALTSGLSPIPETAPEIRATIMERLAQGGLEPLLADLDSRDPETAGNVDRANPRRVARALEVIEATGVGLAEWSRRTPPPLLPPENADRFVLSPDPAFLAERIALRFSAMLDAGALEEVRAVMARDLDPALPALRAHGAPALTRYLEGEWTLERAAEYATIETRQYAKRQRTWARNRFGDWRWIAPERGFAFSEREVDALLRQRNAQQA